MDIPDQPKNARKGESMPPGHFESKRIACAPGLQETIRASRSTAKIGAGDASITNKGSDTLEVAVLSLGLVLVDGTVVKTMLPSFDAVGSREGTPSELLFPGGVHLEVWIFSLVVTTLSS